jgi:hypothetical protein
MSVRIEVATGSGVVAVGDPQTAWPAGLDQDALLRQLEPQARSGRLFFLVTDDPVRYRVDVLPNEPLPPGLDREFEPLGGAFRVEAPSGRLALVGWDTSGEPREAGTVSVSPGTYLLSVFGPRPFDGRRYAEDMTALLGRDAKFKDIVDRLALIGCLPMILVAVALLIARWRWLWYLVPLLVVSWLPFLVLKRSRRYRSAEKRAADAESARPHYVLSLTPTRQADVPGGYVRV